MLQDLTRTELTHAAHRWPEAISPCLWPYALRTANEAYNESPTKTLKRSPIEIFTKTAIMPEPKHWRPFGCPVYVLDNALQNAGGIKHKWSERSRVGIYLGRSPFHARSVALVLNVNTGRVSPQFHVQFDPGFNTIKESFGGKSPPILWQSICGFSRADAETKQLRAPTSDADKQVKFAMDVPQFGSGVTPPIGAGIGEQSESPTSPQAEGAEGAPPDDAPLRRSTRVSKPVIGSRLVDQMLTIEIMQATTTDGDNEQPGDTAPACGELFAFSTLFPLHDEVDQDPLFAYAASADPDTMYYHEAMKEKDSEQFKKAMVKEFRDQWDNGNFNLK